MRTNRQSSMVAMLAICFAVSSSLWACPACNINNYLASSIKRSKNIFIGQVIREVREHEAEVKVTKVLRGDHKVGDLVTTKMYNAKEYNGKTFIISDPTSWPLTFEVLPLELEDEISFLIQDKPTVKDMREAVKRVQGVSVVTRGLGMEYIESHHAEAVDVLIAELNAEMPKVFSSKEQDYFGEQRLGQLVKALYAQPSEAGKRFALVQIDALTQIAPRAIDWTASLPIASSRGVFLSDLFRAIATDAGIAGEVNLHADRVINTIKGMEQADMVFGLVYSTFRPSESVRGIMSGETSADNFAIGLYMAGNYEMRWWQWAKGYRDWDTALAVAKNEGLKKRILEEIRSAERFWKKPTEK